MSGASTGFPIARYSISFIGLDTLHAIKLGKGRTGKSQRATIAGISDKGLASHNLHQCPIPFFEI